VSANRVPTTDQRNINTYLALYYVRPQDLSHAIFFLRGQAWHDSVTTVEENMSFPFCRWQSVPCRCNSHECTANQNPLVRPPAPRLVMLLALRCDDSGGLQISTVKPGVKWSRRQMGLSNLSSSGSKVHLQEYSFQIHLSEALLARQSISARLVILRDFDFILSCYLLYALKMQSLQG
jgi:hypothetical protein